MCSYMLSRIFRVVRLAVRSFMRLADATLLLQIMVIFEYFPQEQIVFPDPFDQLAHAVSKVDLETGLAFG